MTADNRPGQLDFALGHAVERLELLVEEETAALRKATADDLRSFNNRKAQVLVELDRATKSHAGLEPSEAMKARLGGLRQKLDLNRKTLKMHLDAVQEVALMLADQIRDSESDGTYTNGIRRNGNMP